MRSRSVRNSFASHSLALLVGLALAWLAMPLWRSGIMAVHQNDYALLVEQCDLAMRDHFQAKRSIKLSSAAKTTPSHEASEMGLIICQDYDLYQKRLMQWGLRESELAQMRLKAIEARASDLEDIVDIHEIRF